MKRILLAAALLLTCPASAHAALEDGLTTDMLGARQACTSAGQCFVLETRDQVNATWGMRRGYPDQAPDYQSTLLRLGTDYFYGTSRCSSVSDPLRYGYSVPGSCVAVPGTNSIWIVYKRHEFNANPYATLTFVLYHSSDGVHDWIAAPSATYDAAKDAADCNPSGTMSHFMELYPGLAGTGYVATPAAPQGFIDACRLLTREQAAQVVSTGNPPTIPTTIPTTDPTAAATCASITYRRKRVAVASYSVRCTTARTIMANYLARGVEPRGWVCVQARAGMQRTSACGRPATSRARAVRVTARWRA